MLFLKRYAPHFCLFLLAVIISSCSTTKNISKKENVAVEGKKSEKKTATIKKKYSALVAVNENNIENIKLYSLIDEWYGVKYKYGGQNKKGIDCSNFAALLYSQVYHKTLTGSSAAIFNQCKEVKRKNLTEGDLLFFKIEKETISHVGVYLQNNKFVHASTKKGVMIDDLEEEYYKKYFYKAGRLTD